MYSEISDQPYEDILQQLRCFKDKSIQSIITQPPIIQRILSRNSNLDFGRKYQLDLDALNDIWIECKRILKDNGTMWIFCDNFYYNDSLIRVPFNLGYRIASEGLFFRNIIVWYNLEKQCLSRDLANRYSNILFFSKNKNNYKFNLDSVREEHIWKDFEWGGGRESRYNINGKNPSNFWLKTTSKNGKTLHHDILSLEDAITRCILVSSDSNDVILDIFSENAPTTTIVEKNNRISKSCFSKIDYSKKMPSPNFKGGENIYNKPSGDKLIKSLYIKSSEKMEEVKDSSVQLIITSPPYWGLRDYGHSDQIGYNETYEEYLMRLNKVWRECFRIITDTGSLWININKRFINSNVLLFPEDIARNVTEIGFYLKDLIIWHRVITVPGTGPDNFTDRYEFILFFTKKKNNYLFKKDELTSSDYIHTENQGLGNVWKMYRKIGNIGKEIKVMIEERNIRHTAMYPDELVRRIILLCSNEEDIVLDPFVGSGTTLSVANSLGRQWIGYELNPDYKPIINLRLKQEGSSLLTFFK